MNLRQKAKRFKTLYERTLPQKLQPWHREEIPAIKIEVRERVSNDLLNVCISDKAETPMTAVNKLLEREVGKEVLKYINVKIEPSEIPEHIDLVVKCWMAGDKRTEA